MVDKYSNCVGGLKSCSKTERIFRPYWFLIRPKDNVNIITSPVFPWDLQIEQLIMSSHLEFLLVPCIPSGLLYPFHPGE